MKLKQSGSGTLLLAAVTIIFTIDCVITWFTSGEPELIYLPKHDGVQSQRILVHVAGMRAKGSEQSTPIQDELRQYGDLLVVNADPRRTSPSRTVEAVYGYLLRKGYKEVGLDLTSMGARLGTDLIDRIQQDNIMQVSGVVLRDPPMTSADIQGLGNVLLGTLFSIMPPSTIGNYAAGGLIAATFEQPDYARMEPLDAAGRASIERHWSISKHWPASGVTSELRSIFWRLDLPARKYRIPLVLVRSANDDVVSPRTNARWLRTFGGTPDQVIVVTSPYGPVFHSSLREFPQAWHSAQAEALARLYPHG